MYTGNTINHEKQRQRILDYNKANNTWKNWPKSKREQALKRFSHDTILANREFPFLYRNVRDNLIPFLVNGGH